MRHLLFDLRVAARSLSRHPSLALLAVVALALGIGLTGTMFSIVNGAMRELPFEEAHRLIHVERNNLSRDIESMEVPIHDLVDWRRAQTSFEDLAGFYTGTANLAGDGQRPERFSAAFISASAFPMLRVEPQLGRVLRPEEEGPAAPAVAVLGHGLWQQRFGGDPEVLGRTVRINSEPHTVIGVMPQGFRFPLNHDLWLPLRLDPAEDPRGEGTTLEVFGRLEEGVTLDRAAQEMATIATRLAREYPDSNEGVGSVLKPYTEEYIGEEAHNLLLVMLGAVFGVLLIACANVANLLLARAALRTREVAVRSALGARRGRLVTGFLAEALVLAAAGVVVGIGLAAAGVRWFSRAIASTDPPFWLDFKLAGTELAFIAGLGVVAALLAGLVPALRGSGVGFNEVLKDESRGSSGLRLGRFGKTLVVAEVALSCGLLVAAGLMIQSVVNLRTVDLGFATEDVLVARMGLFENDYPDETTRRQFYDDVLEGVSALPGVGGAALASSPPGRWADGTRLAIEGREYPRPQDLPVSRMAVVSPGLFSTLGVDVELGRGLEARDRQGAPPVVVVNRSFVQRFLQEAEGEESAEPTAAGILGRRLRLGGPEEGEPWRTIVGVVPDLAMAGLDDEEEQHGIYVPLAQSDARFTTLMVRTPGADPMSLVEPVRRQVNAVDPDLPLYWVRTLEAQIDADNWHYDVFGTLFMVFGVAALFLATVGLYGVMAFSVSRRSHEVGVRMALGAMPGQVVGLMFRRGAGQLAVGLLLGTGLALALSRALGVVLFRVEPWSPGVFALVLATLALTGTLACLLPARRAARVDPAVALHHE